MVSMFQNRTRTTTDGRRSKKMYKKVSAKSAQNTQNLIADFQQSTTKIAKIREFAIRFNSLFLIVILTLTYT